MPVFLFFASYFSIVKSLSQRTKLSTPATFILVAGIGGAALSGKPPAHATALPPASGRRRRGPSSCAAHYSYW